jgi:hypothetical protein
MIFLSYNHNDKIIIEPIAERLADIFGRDNVFYDSWSIQPGDGIIDRMNEGLQNATHFFFFVSGNSINSKMVKMEWQNAIFKSSKGNCKVIPIRLDETSMPPILAQSLYIDMYSNGLETTITQMVNVIQGNSTYISSNNKFSNLTYSFKKESSNIYHIKIFASHFMEPIPDFLIMVKNNENELSFSLPKESNYISGFTKNLELSTKEVVNAQLIRSLLPITPKIPLLIEVKINNNAEFNFVGVMHKSGEDIYELIPKRI